MNEQIRINKKDLELMRKDMQLEFIQALNELEKRIDKLVTKISAYVIASQVGISILVWMFSNGFLSIGR